MMGFAPINFVKKQKPAFAENIHKKTKNKNQEKSALLD